MKHFGELTSSRDDQSASCLTASWFVGELSCYPLDCAILTPNSHLCCFVNVIIRP